MSLLALPLALFLLSDSPPKPLPFDYSQTDDYRRLQKPVHDSRLLDSAESLEHWSIQGKGEFELTTERYKDGAHALRFRVKTRTPDDVLSASKRSFGVVNLIRSVAGEDWRRFNRVSFWLYPDLPGWRVVNLRTALRNDGLEKLPDVYGNDGNHSLIGLVNHQWNHVVWEIPHLARDKVTSIEFQCRRMGNEPGASDTLIFDIDQIELQRVEADSFEGWPVRPGRIAFNHTGYTPSARKTAIASDLDVPAFDLVDQSTGQTVLTGPVKSVKSALGEFQEMDFSGYQTPGRYVIRAGGRTTPSFAIGQDVWKQTAWKVINFYYTERCGFDVSGIHRVCHRDWMAVHGDKKMPINGGWHDAGDLSQGLTNTSDAVYTMLTLAEVVRARGDRKLADRLLEEARWGLDWVQKTTFHDGYRVFWATMGSWTDGILGNNDDVTADANKFAFASFLAASAEAVAARVLRARDPLSASDSLRLAREDWSFGVGDPSPSGKIRHIGEAAQGALASLELWRATGEERFASQARRFGAEIVASQERGFQGRTVPITGYFYTDSSRREILHYFHPGYSQAPIMALARLCEAFPDAAEWIDWYATAAIHSEFLLKAMATYTTPYGVLPNGLYREDEYLQAEPARREAFRQQVLNGIPLGNQYRLRIFPVWFDFRGHYGTLLANTKSLSTTALMRRDPSLLQLAETQLGWIVGRNPFAQSTMFGEGYDYPLLYSAMSGNLVGALPVGIQTKGDRDVPYWPASNYPNWKEVWVHPAGHWLSILADMAQGISPPAPGFDFHLSAHPASNGALEIRVAGNNVDAHRFSIRSQNLILTGKAPVWRGHLKNPDEPWVAVVIPDGDLTQARDVTGH
jgi:hypothetical protein